MASPPSSSRSTSNVTLISTVKALKDFLDTIGPSSSLYLDLEGTKLCREGTLDLITILVHPDQKASIIDVQTLSAKAFTTASANDDDKTMKSILEDPDIPKYIWDVRNDADALKSLYGVGMSGVIDIQLLENMTRSCSSCYLRGLDKAIRLDLRLNALEVARWTRVKGNVRDRMHKEFAIFSVRPMDQETLQYCVGDVQYLPLLKEVYMKRPVYRAQWLEKLKEESANRVQEAHSSGYEPNGEGKVLAPWGANPAQFFETGRQTGPYGLGGNWTLQMRAALP
ncbi:ribonuclease H-like domain-containing protein [Triangularia setosa]|uniref:Ribonuclease H-like domain-containing protein n=1 Tax=Triangularia setosa TaxID=2587417 RepID=A0AAN6W571_9PEZI|nr:ribonuclease H-like domain-containing protein [Podospora setosa]